MFGRILIVGLGAASLQQQSLGVYSDFIGGLSLAKKSPPNDDRTRATLFELNYSVSISTLEIRLTCHVLSRAHC